MSRDDLRQKLINEYIKIAWTFYFEGSDEETVREELAPEWADRMLLELFPEAA
jgi:hypothetical protein